MSDKIRVIALGILQRADGKILLDKGYDSKKDEYFYRPLGGGVEFGERGEDALIREFKEEINKDIEVVEDIKAVENIFEFEGEKGHQIMFLYKCKFVDESGYDLDEIVGFEDPSNISVWRSIKEIKEEKAKIYPQEILGIF